MENIIVETLVQEVKQETSRKLASIQKILALDPIPGADLIMRATVLGWQCVVKKGDFTVDDLCVYMEVDSVLPVRPEFEFLRPRHFRIKTVMLRKQVSQGICFPLSILPTSTYENMKKAPPEKLLGKDVTTMLGVRKYDPEVPANLRGFIKGNFPEFLHKTDETRIQAEPRLLEEFRGKSFYVSEKVDGSSMTVYLKDGIFGVCSRNLDLKETEDNAFWKTSRVLEIEKKLTALKRNIALQGELVGPGVQKNKYGLDKLDFFVFNVFDVDTHKFLNFSEFQAMVKSLDLRTVPILDTNLILNHTVNDMVEMSKGYSTLNKETLREGIVVRPLVEEAVYHFGRLSFKVINTDFLLRWDE